MIIIPFPVDPHIKKYLLKKVGETMVLSNSGIFETMLIDMLSRKNIHKSDRELPSEKYTVNIPDHWLFKRYGTLSINRSMYLEFNKRVNQAFKNEIESMCRIYINEPKLINTVRTFFEYYEIEEHEFKMDTMLRYLKRKGVVKKNLKRDIKTTPSNVQTNKRKKTTNVQA